jgi:hypothetical protein
MSRTTEDNLGRRRFLLHRDKAVEHALERIRHAPGAGWETLTSHERAGLKSALTEIWENCGHERWQQYCFSTLTKSDILKLTALVSNAGKKHSGSGESREAVEAILLSCSGNNNRH